MEIITITLSEYTDWGRDDAGAVVVHDEEATTSAVVGCATTTEEAAAMIAAFCRARPPVDDGWEEGHEEVLPVSHFTLNAVTLLAPLSAGQSWWAHVGESGDAEAVLELISMARETPEHPLLGREVASSDAVLDVVRDPVLWSGETEGGEFRVRRLDEHTLIAEHAEPGAQAWSATDDETAAQVYEMAIIHLVGTRGHPG